MSNSTSGSAFSRIANSFSNTSSTSQTGSPASAPQDALTALEAQLAKTRRRQDNSDGTSSFHGPRSERGNSGSRSRASSTQRYSPSPTFGSSVVESPLPEQGSYSQSRMSQTTGSFAGASGWGTESLPPNATGAAYSNFSAFSAFAPGSSSIDGSHFFPPGAGFSFEGDGSSPSLNASSSFQFRQSRQRYGGPGDSTFSLPEAGAASSSYWDRSMSRSGRNMNRGGPGAGAGDRSRSRVPTRALHFVVPSVASGDRGMVGLAKPREGGSDRVAVAGKTCQCSPSSTIEPSHLRLYTLPDLKILKVPPTGDSTPVTPPSSLAAPTSIASRRSKSRQNNGLEEENYSRKEVTETLDVKVGSRLGPAFLFTDVRWGHGATANKIATPFSNGAVVLWDLAKESGSRIDQTIYQHDRTVNRVVFGGASGNYLLSAGQDGHVRLWDIREGRATNNVLKTSSPVRQIAFSPSASQPWTLLATCASGTLIRYDLRNASSSRPGASITDRIAGHVGGCLAMDWRDNLESDGPDRKDGGWVVTGGLDCTIKIWDFSLPILSTKPVRSLHSSQGVQAVAWHPTRGNELASSPLPSLSLSRADETPTASTTPNQEIFGPRPAPGSSWKNEIEIWDTRREHFPVMAIKTDEPISAILYNDDDTIWSTSKSTPTFSQFDIQHDSYSMLDSIPRPTASWNVDGEMVFIDDGKGRAPPTTIAAPVESAPIRPASFLSSVPSFDPAYSARAFEHLANSLVLSGRSFEEICDANAEAYETVDRLDASQLWLNLRTWFSDADITFHDETPPKIIPVRPTPRSLTPPPGPTEWQVANHVGGLAANPARRSFSNSLSRGRSAVNSPVLAPVDLNRTFDSFPESRSLAAPEADVSRNLTPGLATIPQGALFKSDPSFATSSDSELDRPIHRPLPPPATISPTALRHRSGTILGVQNGSSSHAQVTHAPDDGTLDGDFDTFGLPSTVHSRLHSRQASSSSGSEDSDVEREHVTRARASRALAQQASRSRRTSSSMSTDRRPQALKENRSRQVSHDPVVMSRRGSAQVGPAGVIPQASHKVVEEPSPQTLRYQAGMKFASEAKEIFQRQLRLALQHYADRGDSQLCASVCTVLGMLSLDLDSFFTTRVSKAYLDLLRKAKLDVAAAGLLKASKVEALQKLGQSNVVYHTACGVCGKGLEQVPFGYCPRCAQTRTRCCICHLPVQDLLMLCAHCGHGAHAGCLESYCAALEAALEKGSRIIASGEASFASTPGIATPGTRIWMWGEEAAEVSETPEADDDSNLQELLLACPAGQCGHFPCYLTEATG